MAEYLVKWPSGREPISKIGPSDGRGRMEFPWRWTSRTNSTNLDVIWGMSVQKDRKPNNVGASNGSLALVPRHSHRATGRLCAARSRVRPHGAKRALAGVSLAKSARRRGEIAMRTAGSGPDSPSGAILATLPVTASGHPGNFGLMKLLSGKSRLTTLGSA